MNENLKKEIFYEIYPHSFLDTDGDGYGDFEGIIRKLGYLQELGVTAIWLNPHFVSSWKDGGYDVVDYYHASPRFGGDEGFLRLLKECHNRQIKLVIDLVAGHTSEDNEMFLQSASAEKTAFDDMFIWTNNVWHAPAPYRFVSGGHDRYGAFMVNFFCTQPALNYGFYEVTQPDWQMHYQDARTFQARDFIVDVCLHYLEMGVDGFRVDMADSLVKDDQEKKGTIEVWQYIFSKVRKKYPQAIFISEWVDLDRSLEAGFDIDFMNPRAGTFANDLVRYERWEKGNTSFLRADSTLDIRAHFQETAQRIKRNKDKGYMAFITGNHDNPRPSLYLLGRELRLFHFVTFTLTGVPFLYYGDEIGMRYQEGIPSKECGFSRTGTRTVMNWEEGKNNGFSTAETPWLPIDETTNVRAMQADTNSLWQLIRRLIALRKREEDLQGNDLEILPTPSERVLCYRRGKLTVVVNPSRKEERIELPFKKVVFYDGEAKAEAKGLLLGAQSAAICE